MSDKYFQDLLQEASKGDPWSQLRISIIFFHGSESKMSGCKLLKPIKKNLVEAFKWVKLAAEQGNSYAENHLGELFYYGDGVQKDYSQSFKWFQSSADKGYNEAQYNLGVHYQRGDFVEKDLIKAKLLFKTSFENGLINAYKGIQEINKIEVKNEENYTEIKNVIKLLNQTSPNTKTSFAIKPKKYIEEKYKEAFDRTYKVANSPKPIWFSYILLGSMYLNGVGVAKDLVWSEHWLRHAYQDLSTQIQLDPFSRINKFNDTNKKQIDNRKISRDTALLKMLNFQENYFQNINHLKLIWEENPFKNKNSTGLIIRKSMLLCPEKSVQIEAYTNYENGKQVLFTQQRFVVPPVIAQSGPYYEKLEGEAEAAGFYGSFYESTGGFGGMTDSERDMFED